MGYQKYILRKIEEIGLTSKNLLLDSYLDETDHKMLRSKVKYLLRVCAILLHRDEFSDIITGENQKVVLNIKLNLEEILKEDDRNEIELKLRKVIALCGNLNINQRSIRPKSTLRTIWKFFR